MTAFGPVRILAEGTRRPSSTVSREAERRADHPLLRLQRRLGNNVVARMVAQREAAPDEEDLMAKHDVISREAAPDEEDLMAKHDPLMREAAPEDEDLMAKHDPLARAADDEELMTSADTSAPRVGLEGGPVGGDIESQIDSQRGEGAPLDSVFRSKMESFSGVSLDSVRVHTGPESDALNRSISAKAFTTGSDIFLRSDVTPGDQSTMAHEVGHVLQQQEMDGVGGGRMTVGAADSPYEHEADEFARTALQARTQEPEEA